ncbi:MAG TPA: TraR/DksA family transcriptional regulator [Planctomycetaceae bacterium]|nr:TraR/DksA family transcriptional regulator [Planctomycetaceae bacterium]
MKKTELAEFKDLLLGLRSRIRGDVEQLTVSALDGQRESGDAKSPTHLAELGTQAYDQDFSLRVVENDQGVIEEITAALKRIDDGTYGLCQHCLDEGKPPSRAAIPKARLRAIPYARVCVGCQRKAEEASL